MASPRTKSSATRSTVATKRAKAARKTPAASPDRRSTIINEAAKLFARKGFDATSMRDIASAVKITVGASYWYFESKEELFSAVHSAGLKAMREAVTRAIDGIEDPWDRLEAAAEAHCEALLNPVDAVAVLIPPSLGPIRRKLIGHRDQYERLFRKLVADVELPEGVDRNVFRLQFLTGLNGTLTWYSAGGKFTPTEIARQYMHMLRRPERSRASKPARR
jgi:AcrR family transcriptional regulator